MKVALLSDIHANLVALEAVLADLPPVEAIWVMGDTVGYGPEPADTLALLRERRATLIAGNHDRAVATGQGLGLFNPAARTAAELHRAWLAPEDRDFLAALPLTLEPRAAYVICHGSPRDPLWEYVFDARTAGSAMAGIAARYCCVGHTHVPATFRPGDGKVMINPGSVGQPRDGDPRAAYALLDPAAGSVDLRRVEYDIGLTQGRMRDRKLPELLADRLRFGL
ncbi:MAG TPA: metallophosphoesterase family protein [Candidatus Limnocylindria bacterium]|nr:metallophosphoesterase family protein [Candidatus Limnocylindria bacterium]